MTTYEPCTARDHRLSSHPELSPYDVRNGI
jgi:hypothetical protein